MGRSTISYIGVLLLALALFAGAGDPPPLRAQGRIPDVVLEAEKTAYQKIDIQVLPLQVLSGGAPAETIGDAVARILVQDLSFTGLFRVGRPQTPADSLHFQFAVEGTVEGSPPGGDRKDLPDRTILTLKLLTYSERQNMLTKRYNPTQDQTRASVHHFVNQVTAMLTGEAGICLTRIVFARGSGDRRDLYVVDYDGQNLLRLTANRTLNLCPSWSPDGQRIAFTSYAEGQQGVYLLETASGKVRRVIATTGLNLGPQWSPDGQELILSLSKEGNPEIYRIDTEGRIKRRLTVSPAIEVSPCWSPSGGDVVFTSDRTGRPQLYIMDGDGANHRRLTFEGQYNDSAVWSPSGERIAYACLEGNHTQLVLISPTGENRRVLTGEDWRSCEDPSWAPDSRHLVFASDRTGTFKLYVVDVVDGDFRQLTFGNEPDITPAWSP